MVTPQEKVQCVSWFIETKSDVQRTKNGKDPPSCSSIGRWHKKFMKTGSVFDAVRSRRLLPPLTSLCLNEHDRKSSTVLMYFA